MSIDIQENIVYCAHFIVEADTPLAVGSGQKGLTVDRVVARDANGLPYIPGSSIAGVLRHHLSGEMDVDHLFGFQSHHGNTSTVDVSHDDGVGSRIIVSSAHILDKSGEQVLEGLAQINWEDPYYRLFEQLPERDHVRITHRGAADVKGHGKFDEQVVHKGARFVFMIELQGTEADQAQWDKILDTIRMPFFRLGAGSRKGFGKLKICHIHQRIFRLENLSDLKDYLAQENSLNQDLSQWEKLPVEGAVVDNSFLHYSIRLNPESFFHFGAGYGDEDVDMQPKTEKMITWSEGNGAALSQQSFYLIPASSVKGALSHRVAYHYNVISRYTLSNAAESSESTVSRIDIEGVLNEVLSDNEHALKKLPDDSSATELENLEKQIAELSEGDLFETKRWKMEKRISTSSDHINQQPGLQVGRNNEAVRILFGYAKGSNVEQEGDTGKRGHVLLEDIYIPASSVQEKVFSHVAIDRFTGGAIDGALYQEKVIHTKPLAINLFVAREAFQGDKGDSIKKAFELTLEDLVAGRLQLGGNTTKGHGVFSGSFECKNS